ncbi:ribonuclease H-like domain-containing protein [Tanacetum coccineum]
MDLESTQNNALAKLPLLKQGDYETWRLRIESYIQLQDYALWEIIEDGNSFKPYFDDDTSNTNGVNTSNVHVSTTSSSLSTASTIDNSARLSDATIYAFLANQPNGSQVIHEDLEKIYEDNLEEMDLKWQLALLSMKARKFHQRTGKKIIINGSDTAGYDKIKVEFFNCHKMGHFVRECKNSRSQESRSINQDSSRRSVNVEESSSKAMLAIDGVGFDWSFMTEEKTPTNFALMAFSDSELNKSEFDLANYKRGLASVEEQLVFYKKNEGMLCDQIAVLKRYASFNESEINALKIQIERLKKEKENWVSDYDEDETLEKVSESAHAQKPKQADQLRKVNYVNAAKGKRVTSDVGEQGIDAVKSKACWVWRPKLKVLDHDSKNSGSYICKQFDYVDPTGLRA